jgi:hypothetical protein
VNKLAIIEQEAAEELDQLKVAIVDYDREFHSAFQRQMGYAFLAGAALRRAEEIIPHGKFLDWCEKELAIKRTSSLRYRKFAEAISKLPTVGNLKEVKLLGAGELLSPAQQKKITDAVHELADGKTLTEMYRDLGVIRQPEKPKHHPRKHTLSPEEELHARKQADLDLANTWRGPLGVWCHVMEDADDHERPHYTKKQVQEFLDELTRATGILRGLQKGVQ